MMPSQLPAVDPAVNHLREYLEALLPADDEVLQALVRETYELTQHPRMLGDRWLCAFLEMSLVGRTTPHVLEVGTFTGYTALRLARAVGAAGHVTTLESRSLHADIAAKYFAAAGVAERVTLLRGDACTLLATFPATPIFDLVFLDADKLEYPRYLELVLPLLRVGGMLVADNVLWSGKTVDAAVSDPHTEALRAFNRAVLSHPALRATLLPAGDGVVVATRWQA